LSSSTFSPVSPAPSSPKPISSNSGACPPAAFRRSSGRLQRTATSHRLAGGGVSIVIASRVQVSSCSWGGNGSPDPRVHPRAEDPMSTPSPHALPRPTTSPTRAHLRPAASPTRRATSAALAAVALALTTATAPPPAQAAMQDPPTLVFTNAHVIDPASAEPLDNATVIVRGGRIERVVRGAAAPPAGAQVVDLRGMYLLPGLIDSHVHISNFAA